MITVTNTATGDKMTFRRLNKLNIHNQVVGTSDNVEVLQYLAGSTTHSGARTMGVESAEKVVANARTAGMTVEGAL